MKNDEELIYSKVKAFFEVGLKVHLGYKNRRWMNGFIREVKPDFFLFNDEEVGLLPVFYIELWDVRKFTEDKTERDDGADV